MDWSEDIYLRKMGKQMREHRSPFDYRPTAFKLAEVNGAEIKIPPWVNRSAKSMFYGKVGPRCLWPATWKNTKIPCKAINELKHPARRRRKVKALAH